MAQSVRHRVLTRAVEASFVAASVAQDAAAARGDDAVADYLERAYAGVLAVGQWLLYMSVGKAEQIAARMSTPSFEELMAARGFKLVTTNNGSGYSFLLRLDGDAWDMLYDARVGARQARADATLASAARAYAVATPSLCMPND